MLRPSTISRLAIAAAAAAAAAVTAVALSSAPAAATGGQPVPCTTITHGDTKPFVNRNAANTADTNGLHKLTADGVKIVTPDNDAKVYGYLPLDPAVKLADITGAAFKNINHEGLLPSYQFGLSVNGAWGGTLAWEQTYQPAQYKQPSDVLHDGNSKWYITKDHPGYTKHTVKTWDELLKLLPANTTAVYYGINQGAGGVATNVVDEVKLKTKTWCKTHTWDTCYASPSPSQSTSTSTPPSASASASTSASASAPVSASATVSASPAVSRSVSSSPVPSVPSLPVTGASVGGFLAVGVGLVAGGAGLLLLLRRRRVQFTP